MYRIKFVCSLLGVISALMFLPAPVAVADEPPGHEGNKDAKTQGFSGKVEAVDVSAKTLKVDGKLIYVTAETKITNKDKAALLDDIKVGDSVHGTTRATFDGKTEAVTIEVGMREKPKKDKGKV